MNDRFGPRTLDPELVQELWRTLNLVRELVRNWERQANSMNERLVCVMDKMKAAGMHDWMPTLDEIHAAWVADGESAENTKAGENAE